MNENPNVALPRSGPDTGRPHQASGLLSPAQYVILDYLLSHTSASDYLVAGLSSHELSGYIIKTGRPALALGGSNGDDDVLTVEGLAGMVEEGELRYAIGGPELNRRKPEFGRWLEDTCTAVAVPGLPVPDPRPLPVLYDCGG